MLFPMLYTMSVPKRASVKEVWRPVGELGGWDLWFKGILMIGKWRRWKIFLI